MSSPRVGVDRPPTTDDSPLESRGGVPKHSQKSYQRLKGTTHEVLLFRFGLYGYTDSESQTCGSEDGIR